MLTFTAKVLDDEDDSTGLEVRILGIYTTVGLNCETRLQSSAESPCYRLKYLPPAQADGQRPSSPSNPWEQPCAPASLPSKRQFPPLEVSSARFGNPTCRVAFGIGNVVLLGTDAQGASTRSMRHNLRVQWEIRHHQDGGGGSVRPGVTGRDRKKPVEW